MVIFLKPLLELESFLFELAFQDVRNLLAKEHFLNTSFSKMSAAYIFLPPLPAHLRQFNSLLLSRPGIAGQVVQS